MTPDRAKLLAELLTELSEDPRQFIPDEAWLPAQKVFALPYIEMAIVRRGPREAVQILLTHRSDEHWHGWHIPGGLWRTNQTLEGCVASIAKGELSENAGVTFLAQGIWEKWHDHPYAMPISHVAICVAQNIVETKTIRWFEEIPEGLIDDCGHHARFITSVLRQAEALV